MTMNTLKLLVRNLSNVMFPTSILDGIVAQGFVPVNGTESSCLPEDWELYSKGSQRVIYNGRTDKIVDRYSITSK